MKSEWIVYIAVLGLTSGLWAQTRNQVWQGQAGMGQIPNNGEISGWASSPNPMNHSYYRGITSQMPGSRSFQGQVPYIAPGDLSMPPGSSALNGFTRYSSPPNIGTSGTSSTYYPSYPSNRVVSHRVPGMMQTLTPLSPQVFQTPQQGQGANPALAMSDMQTLYPQESRPTSTSLRSASSPARYPWGTLTTLTPTPASPTAVKRPSTAVPLDKTPVFQANPTSPAQVKTQLSKSEQPKLGQPSTVSSWQQQTAVPSQDQDAAMSSNWRISQTPEVPDEQSPNPTEALNHSVLATGHTTLPSDNTMLSSETTLVASVPDKPKASTVLSSSEALTMGQNIPQDSGSPALPPASNEEILPLLQEARHDLQTGQAQAALEIYQHVADWRPRAPAVLAGQCISHLALGHLMSSALYLSRWLEAEPKALQQPMDLGASIGSKVLLEQRIQEVQDYLAISEMGELLFLRAFINYKIDHLEQARHDITRALGLKPTLQGAKLLQTAISQG